MNGRLKAKIGFDVTPTIQRVSPTLQVMLNNQSRLHSRSTTGSIIKDAALIETMASKSHLSKPLKRKISRSPEVNPPLKFQGYLEQVALFQKADGWNVLGNAARCTLLSRDASSEPRSHDSKYCTLSWHLQVFEPKTKMNGRSMN
mmetsp:Transcript_8220/g.15174  ORF Transcript_8220/g.15174 Transcript_8220/m.15174 type:complete len:145 (+) Transcript_8220:750-1184(+)